MKKTLFIVSSILIVGLVAFLAYWLLLEKNTAPTDSTGGFPTGRPTTQFPDTGTGSSGGFGGFGDTGSSSTENSGGISVGGGIGTGAFIAPTLRKLSDEPSAGAVAFIKASTTRVRFVERATGHIYEATDADLAVNRISNTTIPKVVEALWLADGSGYYARYLRNGGDTIETYAARYNETLKTVSGTFLPANLQGATIGSDGRLAAVLEGESSTAINIYSISGERVRTAFTSPFSEWLPVWGGAGSLFLYTKPSYSVRGESLRITLSSLASEPSVRGVSGLSLLASPNGSRAIYSSSSDSANRLYAYDFTAKKAVVIPLTTIANDKCVWSRRSATVVYCAIPETMSTSMPDRWYRGEVSFNDSLWRIDTTTGGTKIIGTLELAGEKVDAIGLTVSADDKTFSFINKKDLTPWMLTTK